MTRGCQIAREVGGRAKAIDLATLNKSREPGHMPVGIVAGEHPRNRVDGIQEEIDGTIAGLAELAAGAFLTPLASCGRASNRMSSQ